MLGADACDSNIRSMSQHCQYHDGCDVEAVAGEKSFTRWTCQLEVGGRDRDAD